jgi:hypothetical protein
MVSLSCDASSSKHLAKISRQLGRNLTALVDICPSRIQRNDTPGKLQPILSSGGLLILDSELLVREGGLYLEGYRIANLVTFESLHRLLPSSKEPVTALPATISWARRRPTHLKS